MVKTLLLRLVAILFLAVGASAPGASLVDGPSVATSGTSATITWTTDVSTGSRVQFGTTAKQLDQRAEGELGTQHSVTLTKLRPGTKYFYTVGTARVPLATNSFTLDGATEAIAKTAAQNPAATSKPLRAPPTKETWGNLPSLRDHFERHGGDFKAKDPDDYARMAWEFLQRARAEGLPMKQDSDGVLRVFDPKSRAFAAYNRDGTTKTFFKPNSRDYFDRQPGEVIKPKARK